MASNSISASSQRSHAAGAVKEGASAGAFITLAGRILFSTIFILSGIFHFSQQDIAYATQAGIPMAGFLVPVTLMMHNFWAVKDPLTAQIQMAMFMKNVSMVGGALLISQFGAGPLSLDARRK